MGTVTKLPSKKSYGFEFDAKLRVEAKLSLISQEDGHRTRGILDFDVLAELPSGKFVSIKQVLDVDTLREMKIAFVEAVERSENE